MHARIADRDESGTSLKAKNGIKMAHAHSASASHIRFDADSNTRDRVRRQHRSEPTISS